MADGSGFEAFLRDLVTALERSGVDYMIVGSLASSAHGEPRSTQDVDVVVRLTRTDVRDLARQFPEDEFYFDGDMALDAIARGSQFNVVDMRTAWKADLIIARGEFTHTELRRRVRVRYGDVEMWVASPEDVVVAKMDWVHQGAGGRQIEDAAGVIRTCGESFDRAYVEAWVSRLGLAREWARLLEELAGET